MLVIKLNSYGLCEAGGVTTEWMHVVRGLPRLLIVLIDVLTERDRAARAVSTATHGGVWAHARSRFLAAKSVRSHLGLEVLYAADVWRALRRIVHLNSYKKKFKFICSNFNHEKL